MANVSHENRTKRKFAFCTVITYYWNSYLRCTSFAISWRLEIKVPITSQNHLYNHEWIETPENANGSEFKFFASLLYIWHKKLKLTIATQRWLWHVYCNVNSNLFNILYNTFLSKIRRNFAFCVTAVPLCSHSPKGNCCILSAKERITKTFSLKMCHKCMTLIVMCVSRENSLLQKSFVSLFERKRTYVCLILCIACRIMHYLRGALGISRPYRQCNE